MPASVNLGGAYRAEVAGSLEGATTVDGVQFIAGANMTHRGACTTAAATVAKAVSIQMFTLTIGAMVNITFTNTNTAVAPTLNVSATGAKSIRYKGAALTSSNAGYIAANVPHIFVYDGSYWNLANPAYAP